MEPLAPVTPIMTRNFPPWVTEKNFPKRCSEKGLRPKFCSEFRTESLLMYLSRRYNSWTGRVVPSLESRTYGVRDVRPYRWNRSNLYHGGSGTETQAGQGAPQPAVSRRRRNKQ